LNFEVLDDAGDFIPEVDVVSSIKLNYPTGNEVSLSQLELDPDLDFLYGRYDTNNSQWICDKWQMVKDYWAEILDPLTNGAYRLVVATDDAQTLVTYYTFNVIVDIPIVSDRLFQVQSDSQGNLIWTSETPKALYTLSQS